MPGSYDDIRNSFWNELAARRTDPAFLEMARPARLEFETLLGMLNLPTGSRLLDFGCGTGRYALPLAKLGYDITAVDISKEALAALDRHAKDAGLSDSIHTLKDDFRTAPFVTEFDGAYSVDVLYQTSDTKAGRAAVLANVVKTVKPGGAVLAVEPNPLNPLYYPAFLFHPEVSWKIEKKFLNSSPGRLRRRFREAGLQDIKIKLYAMLPTRLMNTVPGIEQVNRCLCAIPGLRQFSLFTFIRGTKPAE